MFFLNRSREIPPEAVGGGIFASFPYDFRPEVDNDVISGVAVKYFGVDVGVKFGDSTPNRSRDIRGADFVSNERTNMTEAYHMMCLKYETGERWYHISIETSRPTVRKLN